MSARTKKGYLWVFDQQDKWDDILMEKTAQLDDVTNSHLDWFKKHSTVSELITWKRPLLNSKVTNRAYSADSSYYKTNSQNNELCTQDSNLELDVKTHIHQTESITEEAQHDTTAIDPAATSFMNNSNSSQNTIQQTQVELFKTSFSLDAIKYDNANTKSDEETITINTPLPYSIPFETALNNVQLDSKVPAFANIGNCDGSKGLSTSKEHDISLSYHEYDEHEDEIQLVVSTRNYEAEIRQQQQQNKKIASKTPSPIKPPSPSMPSVPAVARHQSSFMSRLFKMGRPSIDNIKNLPSPIDKITTKRPSLDSVKSESREIPIEDYPSQDIAVSELMPASGPRLKKVKLMPLPVKNASNNIPTSISADNCQQKAEDEPKEEENPFKIPDWAKSPDLTLHLQKQAELDPDKIFGRIQTFQIRDIFPPRQKYSTEIPKHAPE